MNPPTISLRVDLVKEMSYEADDRSGTLVRGYVVSGLNSASDISDQALRAVDATDNSIRIPVAGQYHEKMPELVCRRVRVGPFIGSPTQVKVWAFYAQVKRRLLDAMLNGVSVNTTTELDLNGRPLYVGYKPPATYGGASTPPGDAPPPPAAGASGDSMIQQNEQAGWRYDYGQAPIFLPETTYEVVYLEDTSPWQKIRKYVRCLNSRPWNGGVAGEWFCESIIGKIDSPIPRNMAELGSQDVITGREARFNWVTTYKFRFQPLYGKVKNLVVGGPAWESPLLFVDRSTGLHPTDINPAAGGLGDKDKTEGNGWRIPKLFDRVDLDELKLVTVA